MIATVPGSTNTSVSDGPVSPTVNQECLFDNEQESSESLRNLLQEVCIFGVFYIETIITIYSR